MSKSPKKKSNVGTVLRYVGLVLLTVVFAVFAPILLVAQRTYDALTDEATYSAVLNELGLGKGSLSLVSLKDIAPEMLVDMIEKIKPDGPSPVDELTGELETAVEKTRSDVVAQVPIFVAGKQDKFKAAVDLTSFRKKALDVATKYTPGGSFGAALVRQGIESSVPKTYELDKYLGPLESLLMPLRKTVQMIKERITYLRVVVISAFLLIALVSFQIKRALMWLGIAISSSGVVGFAIGSLASGLLNLVLPELIGVSFIKTLISNAVTGYRQISLISVGVGLFVMSLAFLVTYLIDRSSRDQGK